MYSETSTFFLMLSWTVLINQNFLYLEQLVFLENNELMYSYQNHYPVYQSSQDLHTFLVVFILGNLYDISMTDS